ncbi:MAG: hypothetical protein J3K34DRAFT_402620 [Monoraphidium minutum]|nr:MAG: hypothetical protein J3K34DRAFT_402620 [Monoraphidium minutum]
MAEDVPIRLGVPGQHPAGPAGGAAALAVGAAARRPGRLLLDRARGPHQKRPRRLHRAAREQRRRPRGARRRHEGDRARADRRGCRAHAAHGRQRRPPAGDHDRAVPRAAGPPAARRPAAQPRAVAQHVAHQGHVPDRVPDAHRAARQLDGDQAVARGLRARRRKHGAHHRRRPARVQLGRAPAGRRAAAVLHQRV